MIKFSLSAKITFDSMTLANPGFPVGKGALGHYGAPTSEAGTFQRKCMQK